MATAHSEACEGTFKESQRLLEEINAKRDAGEEITDELVMASMESLRKFVLAPCEFCDGTSIIFDIARKADAAGYTPDFGPESNKRIVEACADDLIIRTAQAKE